jgi:hypothetical protein
MCVGAERFDYATKLNAGLRMLGIRGDLASFFRCVNNVACPTFYLAAMIDAFMSKLLVQPRKMTAKNSRSKRSKFQRAKQLKNQTFMPVDCRREVTR